MIELQLVRNIILNNIDLYNQLSRMHGSPPGVFKNCHIKKSQRFDKSDTGISYLIIECFSQDKSCQKCHFKQHCMIFIINLPGCIFSPQDSQKFQDKKKLNDVTNLTQVFQI